LTGSHDDDGPTAVADDERGDAPEQEVTDETTGVAADDDHVRTLGFGCLEHRCAGVTEPDEVLGRDATLSGALDDPRQGLLALGADLIDPGVEQASRKLQATRVDDVQQDQARPDPR